MKNYVFLIHSRYGAATDPIRKCTKITIMADNRSQAKARAIAAYEGNCITKITQVI